MTNKLSTVSITIFSLVFIGIFVMFPSETFACSGPFLHQDHVEVGDNDWTGYAYIGFCGPVGLSAGAYDNIIFTNLEPGRYEILTHGNYGGQSDEHMVIAASDGDMDTIFDLDGDAAGPSWLWGQGIVDMCEQSGSVTVRAYSQDPDLEAVYSLDVDEVRIEKIGYGGCVVVQCSVSPTTAQIDETVTWTANASGGKGTHVYTWSGDVSGTKEIKNRVLDFDGVDDYVQTSTITHNIGTGDFAFSAWINPATFPSSYSTIMSNGAYSPGFYAQLNGGNKLGAYWGADLDSGATITPGEWTFVVMQREGTTIKFYKNGFQTPTEHTVSTSMANDVLNIATGNPTVSLFNGLIDNVRIYNRALSSIEIDDLYNSEPISDSGLVGYWMFEEGSGIFTWSVSSGGNRGDLKNGPEWTVIPTTYSVDTSYSTAGEKTGQVTVTPGPSTCPFKDGDGSTVIEFNELISSNQNEAYATAGPISNFIPAGTYDITLVSYDSHSVYGGGGQFEEQWYLILDNENGELITTTSAISDLSDEDDQIIETVETDFVLSENVFFTTAFHNAYLDSNGNSIYPLCAVFELEDAEAEIHSVTASCDSVFVGAQCKNSSDDDGDGRIDAGDPGCYNPSHPICDYDPDDNDETDSTVECSNCIDDDGDGFIDAADTDCYDGAIYDPDDNDESTFIPPVYQCGNSLDDDGDGRIDAGDPGCYNPSHPICDYDPDDNDETDSTVECSNCIDDDGDGFIDFPADPGCIDASDILELTIKFEET